MKWDWAAHSSLIEQSFKNYYSKKTKIVLLQCALRMFLNLMIESNSLKEYTAGTTWGIRLVQRLKE